MKYSYFTRYPLEIYVVLKFMSSSSLKGIAHVVPLLMFYNQNQLLPELLCAKYLSEILGVLYMTFADEIKTHSILELPGVNIRHIIFYLAFKMLKLFYAFDNLLIQCRCLKWMIARFFCFTMVI